MHKITALIKYISTYKRLITKKFFFSYAVSVVFTSFLQEIHNSLFLILSSTYVLNIQLIVLQTL